MIYNVEYNFIELYYYDGSKLEVDVENKKLLLWYDETDDYELWYYIESEEELMIEYLSNKVTILDVIQKSKVKLGKRYFEDYYDLVEVKALNNNSLKSYELPTNESYLGFNFYKPKYKEKK